MRARYLTVGVLIVAAACSRPAADETAQSEVDARDANPDLALTGPVDAVPVASGIEMHQAEAAHKDGDAGPDDAAVEQAPAPEPAASKQSVEPVGAAPAAPAAPAAVATSHVHPKAQDPEVMASVGGDAPAHGDSAEGEGNGGKPTGVNTGLGPVPDRDWGDPAIIDDPDPLAGTLPGIGRAGAVIIRGGAGGVDDDCAIHPRGGVAAIPVSGPGVLINDRAPRAGTSINERAPRGAQRPSLPRGGGLPRGGIR